MTTTNIIRGFHNPTHDSQKIFRYLLKAMSEPGTQVQVSSPEAPAPLYNSTFAVCQALLDQQTSLWLSPQLNTTEAQQNLHFHTGVVITKQHENAAFALLNSNELDHLTMLSNEHQPYFSHGSSEYPEVSCTLLIQVEHIEVIQSHSGHAKAMEFRLTGPGIKTERLISISQLSLPLISYLTDSTGARKAQFPLGLDFIFIDPRQLICLPRTTKVEVL